MRSEKGGDNATIIGVDINLLFLFFLKKYRVYDEVIL